MLKKIITKRSESWLPRFNILTVLTVALAAIFVAFIIFKIPPSMDEYLPYHQLACLMNGTQNIFREGCSEYNLTLFGKSLALRSYGYVGFSNSLFYLPIYLIWKSYLSARFLKLIFLILTAIFTIKITKIDWKIGILIVCCFFPFAFQMLVDTGPIAFQCLSIAFIIWLCSRGNYGLREGLLAGVVGFLAVEQKMFFAPFLIPVFIYCIIAYGNRGTFSKITKFFVPIGLIIAVGVMTILLAKTTNGTTYMAELSDKFSRIPLADFGGQVKHLATFKPFVASFYNFTESVISASSVRDSNTLFLYILVLFVAFTALRLVNKNSRPEIRGLLAGVTALLLSVWLLGLSKDSARGHHLAILLPFLLLSILSMYKIIQAKSYKIAYALAIIFFVPNFLILNRTIRLTPLPQDDWSRIQLMTYTSNLPGEHNAYVMSDWGTYYLMSLYIKKNTPVYFGDIASLPLRRSINQLIAGGYNVYLVARERPADNVYNF